MRCIKLVYVPRQKAWVPCGKCPPCLSKSRSGWVFRLKQELKHSVTADFLTLTYDKESISYEIESRKPTLIKEHYQTFIRALRDHQKKKSKLKIRYYAVGEYGQQTVRPHYHAIIYNMVPETLGKIEDLWGKGNVHRGDVNGKTINYCAGYVINRFDHKDKTQKPFSLMSKGLGKSYLTPQMVRWHLRNYKGYAHNEGQKVSLPRYYKEKIFNKALRPILASKSLDFLEAEREKQIARLALVHPDPENYLADMERQAVSRIRTSKPNRYNI